LPWLAALFFRAFFLRDFFAMASSNKSAGNRSIVVGAPKGP
jgi:hypothetical protein